MARARDFTMSMLERAKNALKRDANLAPVAMLVDKQNNVAIMPLFMIDSNDNQAAAIRKAAEITSADFIVIIKEAWVAKFQQNKREAIIASWETRSHETGILMQYFHHNEVNEIIFDELDEQDGTKGAVIMGIFANLLRSRNFSDPSMN